MAKMPNMNQMMKMAQDMARQMETKMNDLQVEGNAGGGMVRVVLDGHKAIRNLTIAPEVVDPEDIDMLQDLIIAALNDAQGKVDEAVKGGMGNMMPGGLPFGF